jgi:hypothetical protein
MAGCMSNELHDHSVRNGSFSGLFGLSKKLVHLLFGEVVLTKNWIINYLYFL